MKKKKLEWLPIDRRIIPDIFSFSRVKGLARVFLEIEIISAICVVAGTLILVFFKAIESLR